MIEGRELTRGERRRDKSGPMRQHQPELSRHECCVRRYDESVRTARKIADQYSVESRLLMCIRKAADVINVDDGSSRRMYLGSVLGADHSDKFHAHGQFALKPAYWTTRLLRNN